MYIIEDPGEISEVQSQIKAIWCTIKILISTIVPLSLSLSLLFDI